MDKGKVELAKGKEKMEQALGLGAKPNVIPTDVDPNIHGELRPVYIGWHPVAGMAGTWFAEKTGLGKKITEKIHSYPDPTQHWAILVGGYVHQLWMVRTFRSVLAAIYTPHDDLNLLCYHLGRELRRNLHKREN